MLHGFWKVQYRFARKCCAGVICYRLGPTLKSSRENHLAEKIKKRKEMKEKKRKTNLAKHGLCQSGKHWFNYLNSSKIHPSETFHIYYR